MTISLVCHACKRLAQVPGTPVNYEAVWSAARDHGWHVEGRRVRCPLCQSPGPNTSTSEAREA